MNIEVSGFMPDNIYIGNVRVSNNVSIGLVIDICKDAIDTKKSLLITFVNPHAAWLVERRAFAESLERFDLVLCDGIGMIAGARLLGVRTISRLSFDSTSLALPFLGLANQIGASIVLVGGKPGITAKAAQVLSQKIPYLKFDAMFCGYDDDLTQAQSYIISNEIPIVIVGMGAIIQEEFLLQLRNRGWLGVGVTCGGYFDQVAEGIQYYPDFINRFNLRFLYRIYKEPRRLFQRYLVQYQIFFKYLFKQLLKKFRDSLRKVNNEIRN